MMKNTLFFQNEDMLTSSQERVRAKAANGMLSHKQTNVLFLVTLVCRRGIQEIHKTSENC